MTVGTGKRLSLDRESVSVHGKSQQVMRELPTYHDGKRCIRATMFRMAVATFQPGVALVHGAMQRKHVLHLESDLAMTIGATLGHADRRPRRGMAGFTFAARLSM